MIDPVILVFSRMSSRRLPGKAIADLSGRPMLGRVLDRLKLVQTCVRIIVATSDHPLDDPIWKFTEGEDVEVFRGDCADVARRALECCESNGINRFVRISGDSPFIPPELIDEVVATSQTGAFDLVTNIHPRSWPFGASVEVVSTEALRRAYPLMNADEREHVTTAFYSTPGSWHIRNIPGPDGRYEGVHLTVDTREDLERARDIVELLGLTPEKASLERVVQIYRRVTSTQRSVIT